ncbi:apoptotic chromatin condensation inducer in the nucleus [Benincasa hispida]|uniref:apoptotic chromatin condensation inducer in the nucleus n=1 Tax=Benincasa hispida TaxID=102211 RepID=UPI0019003AA9|nr:apoptotic chromatin condensation inducer in the nucleus [Benincasa hispida]
MSSKSKYSVLDNRPIDQWKVAELKEELKRRKLTIKGLKEDLVKRLDEALRIEREENGEETNGVDDDPPVTDSDNNQEHASIVSETTKESNEDANMIENVDDVGVRVDKDDSNAAVGEGEVQDGVGLNGSPRVEEGSSIHVTTVETKVTVTETVISEVALGVEGLQNMESKDNEDSKVQSEIEESRSQLDSEDSKHQLDSEESKPQLVSEDSKPQLDSEDSKPQLDSEDSKPQLDNEDSKSQLDDVNMELQVENENLKSQQADLMHDSSAPDDQVSEVSPVLGSQVRTDSISTDSVTINEMIELKENISADHVKLELDVKQEMVEPSSSIIVPDAGESHPMDVEEPPVNKNVEESLANRDVVESPENKDVVEPIVKDVEEKHGVKDIISELHEKHDGEDVGFSEKLNLDRSSGDDSIEDAIENKTDSGYNPEEMGDKNVKNEGLISKEEKVADIAVRGSSADKKNIDIENDVSSLPAEKRRLHDQAVVGNESVKRQRRWNSENLKIPEPQNAAHTSTSNSKDIHQSTAPKRNFSRSDSTASEDPSKERVVPPSPKPPTNSLRIDRFLRPFTLKAVQELLGKTGNVTSFWMDHIKTHCYVTYSSVEEAMKTRDAVYNLQWPPNGGRLLMAEFVDPQEVKNRVEAPQTPTPAAVAPPVSNVLPPVQPEPSPRQPRQQHAPPPSLPPPPPTNNLAQAREQLPLPPPPALPDKVDTPIVTLDDLFRKTKATPRIYYLPLSDEQVQVKQTAAARGKDTKQ